jgi:hypothetical protein
VELEKEPSQSVTRPAKEMELSLHGGRYELSIRSETGSILVRSAAGPELGELD